METRKQYIARVVERTVKQAIYTLEENGLTTLESIRLLAAEIETQLAVEREREG